MKIYERLKNYYLNNKEYYIAFSNNYIYIINYKKIIRFDEKIIEVLFDNFKIIISGFSFKIKRKSNIELEITGKFLSMESLNEI